MKHTIKVSDIEQFVFERQLAGSFGKGEHKSINAVVHGISVYYEVFDHCALICKTIYADEAVEAYNSI